MLVKGLELDKDNLVFEQNLLVIAKRVLLAQRLAINLEAFNEIDCALPRVGDGHADEEKIICHPVSEDPLILGDFGKCSVQLFGHWSWDMDV